MNRISLMYKTNIRCFFFTSSAYAYLNRYLHLLEVISNCLEIQGTGTTGLSLQNRLENTKKWFLLEWYTSYCVIPIAIKVYINIHYSMSSYI